MIYPITILKEIYNYVKKPTPIIFNDDTFGKKIKFILTSILIILVLKLVFSVVNVTLHSLNIVDFTNHAQEKIAEKSLFDKIFWIVLLGPLFEELAFRLYLKWKVAFIVISFSLIGVWFYNKYSLPSNNGLLNLENINQKLIFIAGSVILLSAILFPFKTKVENWGLKHFKYIFYFSVLAFAFMHIQNYTLNLRTILFSPLFIMPQLFGGLNDAYIRMKYGIFWSYLAHMINNFIFISGKLLF